MFKCQSCKQTQPAGTKMNKVVTQIRKVTYPPVKDKEGNITRVPDGFEIVKELCVCPSCSTKQYNSVLVGSKTIEEKD